MTSEFTRQLFVPGATPATEPQPSTSGIQQNVNLPRQKKRRRDSSSSSDDASAKFLLQDTEESETFSNLDEQPPPSTPPLQSSSFLQNLMAGNYVLVRYDGELYPGQIIEVKNDDEVLVSAMKKSPRNWKWPAKPDKIFYSKDEIVQKINQPTQIGRREIFKVLELIPFTMHLNC